MAYDLAVSINLGSGQTGLTLKAKLVDVHGEFVTEEFITNGFTEIGKGTYLWYYNDYPNGFKGAALIYNDEGDDYLTLVDINPPAHSVCGVTTRDVEVQQLAAEVVRELFNPEDNSLRLSRNLKSVGNGVTGGLVPNFIARNPRYTKSKVFSNNVARNQARTFSTGRSLPTQFPTL